MKEAAEASTDVALARFLGIPRGTIASWRRRKSVPMNYVDEISKKCHVSWDWLIVGDAVPKMDYEEDPGEWIDKKGRHVIVKLDPQILAISIERVCQLQKFTPDFSSICLSRLSWYIAKYYRLTSSAYMSLIELQNRTPSEALRILRTTHGLSPESDVIFPSDTDQSSGISN